MSEYLQYDQCGYTKMRYHRGNLNWRQRVQLVVNNEADFNSDFQELEFYGPGQGLTPVPFKFIEWPPRKFWYHQHYIDRDFRKMQKHVAAGEDWIIVEPFMVADTCGRWIEVGNSFHKTAAWGGVFSMVICFLYPNWKIVYWPLTIISFFSMIGYFIFMKDPINQYQIETNYFELSRFPMKTFYTTPLVFRKTPNIKRRICHRIISCCCLAYSIYFLPRYPPCGCAWGSLDNYQDIVPPGYWSYWSDL